MFSVPHGRCSGLWVKVAGAFFDPAENQNGAPARTAKALIIMPVT
jgi:hypothetical protein